MVDMQKYVMLKKVHGIFLAFTLVGFRFKINSLEQKNPVLSVCNQLEGL